jgi:hypothetical protein
MNAMPSPTALPAREACVVMAIYDTERMRTRAIAAHHYLLDQCRGRVELEFHWWRTAFLTDPLLAHQATRDALECDCLFLCLEEDPAAAPALESWFEGWIARRPTREGALIDITPKSIIGRWANARERFFRDLCQRGGLDWLAVASRDIPSGTNAQFQTNNLADRPTYPHFGLNE